MIRSAISVNLSEQAPGVGADGILQFKEPLFFPDSGPAEINCGFDAHILDVFRAEDLLNIDPEQLVLFILYPQTQGAITSTGNICCSMIAPPSDTEYIIARLFELGKCNFLVASPAVVCYNDSKEGLG